MLTSGVSTDFIRASCHALNTGLAVVSENALKSWNVWTVNPPERIKIPWDLSPNQHHSHHRVVWSGTHRRDWRALPTRQFASISKLSSMLTCTTGTSSVSPNISLNGTNTPWSNPGPGRPVRPSRPRGSVEGERRAGSEWDWKVRTIVCERAVDPLDLNVVL